MHLLEVNAQVFVGGGLELNFNNGKSSFGSTENSASGFGFNISPQVGYYINEDWAIGVNGIIGRNWSNVNRTDLDDPTINQYFKSFNNSWGFNFFVRNKLLGFGIEDLSLLVECLVGVQGGSNKHIEGEITMKAPGSTVYSINARPVLLYKISNKLSVLAYWNFLSICYQYQTQKNSDNNYIFKNHNFNMGFNSFSSYSNLNIGFIYEL